MDSYIVLLLIIGAVVLLTAWLPMVLKELPVTLPMVCIGLGVALDSSFLAPVLSANPLANREVTERLTEIVLIVALMGAGLKITRPVEWRAWSLPWRLLGVAMPLTIAGIALIGWGLLGLDPASAALLGAALASTDPVLASDVQLGEPGGVEEDDVRFALTAEAGLNDGLSFPFVYLAIALASAAEGGGWLWSWLAVDVIWRLLAGLACGWAIGRVLGYLTFRLPTQAQLSRTGDGFVAIGIAFLVYGVAELVHGYGFLAVFVAALTLRASERKHSYHGDLHAFAEQIERLFMMALLVCFGAAIAEGAIFDALTVAVAIAAGLIILVVRPLCAWICLAGAATPREERGVIAFFGIRGLGSFYYLAFALGQAEFQGAEALWVTVCLVVLASIMLHGVAVTPSMRRLDRRRP